MRTPPNSLDTGSERFKIVSNRLARGLHRILQQLQQDPGESSRVEAGSQLHRLDRALARHGLPTAQFGLYPVAADPLHGGSAKKFYLAERAADFSGWHVIWVDEHGEEVVGLRHGTSIALCAGGAINQPAGRYTDGRCSGRVGSPSMNRCRSVIA